MLKLQTIQLMWLDVSGCSKAEVDMDVSMNTSAALTQGVNDAVGVAVLKKAMDIEVQNAQMLLDAISQPAKSSANLPPNLGQNINTTA